jgi:hypothetical protein
MAFSLKLIAMREFMEIITLPDLAIISIAILLLHIIDVNQEL